MCGDNTTPAALNCISILLPHVIQAAFILVGIITVIIIILSGIKLLTSGGDNKQVEGAKKTLTYAIIGLSIVLFSYFIINIIATITGVNCIKTFSFDSCR